MRGHFAEEVFAAIESLDGEAGGEFESVFFEVGSVGVLANLPRIVFRPRNPAC